MTVENQTLAVGARFHPGPIGSTTGTTLSVLATRAFLRLCERARQRRNLSNLTPRELDDVGISGEAASAEAAKPFWQT